MPSSRHSSAPRRAGRHAVLALFLLIVIVAFLIVSAAVTNLLAPASLDKSAKTVLVTIPAGSNVRTIGALLERHHLVHRALGFTLAARLEQVSGKMKAGHYELSPAMPPRQIALLLAVGHTASDVVIIPEGFTVAQIASRLAENHLANGPEFLALARTQGRTFSVDGFRPPDNNLEGYLYPDTYRLPKNASARAIITQMLHNFHTRVLAVDGPALAQAPEGLSDVVNLASLVEREAEVDKDRPLVAAALSNRLAKHMRLQCDASVQYALPAHKTRVLYADLRVNSPYNTYLHAGLPPTPICNPGLPSIEAALHPAPVDYLFYVARPDGSHIFTRTLAEHDRAIASLRAASGRS